MITYHERPGYSQGYDLEQSTEIDSSGDFRRWWGYKAIKFAVGLISQPVGIAWGLIDIATAFSPQSIDFDDAGYADSMAISWWDDNFGYLEPVYNPNRQYCLNSWKWKQDAINPQGFYGLKVYARIGLDSDINKWGNNYDPEQFPFGYIDTPPVYLRIGQSRSLSISSDSHGNTNPAPGTYYYSDGQSVSVTALPYSGYRFNYWTLDGTVVYSNPIQVTMNMDHSLSAHFRSTSGGGGGCILYNTRVLMADGKTMPVQAIKPGDTIIGYDLQSGTFMTETIISNSHTIVNNILSINDGLLYVTPTDQPIYTDHGWVRHPRDLMVGWQIYNPVSNVWISIEHLEEREGHFLVYDLRATTPDTFIGNGILLDFKTKI